MGGRLEEDFIYYAENTQVHILWPKMANQMWKRGLSEGGMLHYFCPSSSNMRLRRNKHKWTKPYTRNPTQHRAPGSCLIAHRSTAGGLGATSFFRTQLVLTWSTSLVFSWPISAGTNATSLLAAPAIPPKRPRRRMLCTVSRPVSIYKSSLKSPDNNELPDCACSTSH